MIKRGDVEKRLYFIDNLRTLLIILVILQHLSITVGGPGSWYIEGHTDDLISSIFLITMHNAVNESFFMAFLFMLSGYFTPASYKRKGARAFLKDRLARLGIPLLFYDFIINPITGYFSSLSDHQVHGSIWSAYLLYIKNFSFGTGPLWFVERLIIFNVGYALWCLIKRSSNTTDKNDYKVPDNKHMLIFAFILGLITFYSENMVAGSK
ncbi:acyltransferase family protein [Candidatus Poribacteria bacterium]|nr:acyltransferase family protein [Candidatus Poribacteria bacterium]